MNFYKFVRDDSVINVSPTPVWVGEDSRGRRVLCDLDEAKGIVFDDEVYHIQGANEFLSGEYPEVIASEISEEEYNELYTLLDLGAKVAVEDSPEWEEPAIKPEPEIDGTLEQVKLRCIERLREQCQEAIFAGIDVKLSSGSEQHFDLELEDQINLINLYSLALNGQDNIPYHASNSLCQFYSAEDIKAICEAALEHKTYHTSYFNSLKNWVMGLDSIAAVGAVAYGDDIPAEYCSEVLIELAEDK